jgi:hypothetical protein
MISKNKIRVRVQREANECPDIFSEQKTLGLGAESDHGLESLDHHQRGSPDVSLIG